MACDIDLATAGEKHRSADVRAQQLAALSRHRSTVHDAD
jgi:hypothetical protein